MIHVSEIGLLFIGLFLSPFLNAGQTLAYLQSSGILPLSFTWLDMFDRNTSNCFITDSNDQLTAETLAFSSYKTNQNNL